MQAAHKIELKLNNRQRTYFKKACGVSRFVYNWGLAEWNRQYDVGEKPNAFKLKKEFNSLKKAEFPWTGEVTKYAAQQPFIDLQNAFQRYFKKLGGKPQFKKKGKSRDSFYVGGDQIKVVGTKIHIPNLGKVRLKEALRFDGKINSATFSRIANKWFVSIQVDAKDKIQSSTKGKQYRAVGVDLGILNMVVTSDGHALKSPQPLKKQLRKLAREQRKLSKKILAAKNDKRDLQDSKNFQKQKNKLARIHYKISCVRKDTLHKITSFLAKNYTDIAIEDLNVRGMVKNHNLARSISDVGFGEFRRQLEYKTARENSNLIIVDRFFPSSKKCSECDSVKENLSLKERTFICECGFETDRDLNSAFNLKNQITKIVGRVPSENTPVEITALQKAVYPIIATSIAESGNKLQYVV